MNHFQFQTRVGAIALTWNSNAVLTHVDWYQNSVSSVSYPRESLNSASLISAGLASPIADLIHQLSRYFSTGEPIDCIPWQLLDCQGLSEFQMSVYRALSYIPYGETRTYAWVASRIGKIMAPRAVGQALRKNPFPILIPCHRVVSEKALGGFMGMMDPDLPELQLKKNLLEIERNYCNPVFSFFQNGFGRLRAQSETLNYSRSFADTSMDAVKTSTQSHQL